MHRRTLISWAALGVAGCAQAAGSADAASREYRALRSVRGHFDGGAYDETVDRWQGRKHVLMQQLAGELLRERATTAQVRERMGEPDAALDARAPANAKLLQRVTAEGTARPDAIWLYRWRGARDQLAFALTGGRVIATVWLYEYE